MPGTSYNVGGKKVTKKEYNAYKAGIGGSGGSKGAKITPKVQAAIDERKAKDAELSKIKSETGKGFITPQDVVKQEGVRTEAMAATQPLISQIQSELEQPPLLQPTKVGDLLNTNTGLAAASTATASLPVGLAAAEGAILTGGAIASTIGVGTTIAGALGIAAAGFAVSGINPRNIGGDKIDSYKGVISEMSSQAMIEAEGVQAGQDPRIAIKNLEQMYSSLLEAEEGIRTASIYNVEFRMSKEYLDVQAQSADTRREIKQALIDIQNLMISGQTGVPRDNVRIQ